MLRSYYATSTTTKTLVTNSRIVFLYGGFTGYDNFGDIIQLRNTIRFYVDREITPIVILHLSATKSRGRIKYLEKNIAPNLLFIAVDSKPSQSLQLQQVILGERSIPLLHIYGGGFLNKIWGKTIVENIHSILDAFSVARYIFSGQQVDSVIIPHLTRLFKDKYPILIGVRDRESLRLLSEAQTTVKTVFTFDDTIEFFKAIIETSRNLQRRDNLNIALHINNSAYTRSNPGSLSRHINTAKKEYPELQPIIMQAYNDSRGDLRDSLRTIADLGNCFPYTNYRVLDIAKLAMGDIDKEEEIEMLGQIASSRIALASSYHVSLLLNLMQVPTYLLSKGTFYEQKQKALGLQTSLNEFLERPQYVNYKSELDERRSWLEQLGVIVSSIFK